MTFPICAPAMKNLKPSRLSVTPLPPWMMAPISNGRWPEVSWNGVTSLPAVCAETKRAQRRRAKTQTAILVRRCVMLVKLGLRMVAGRRRPPVNGGRLGLTTGWLVAGTGHGGFVEVEVGVDVLRVIEVFEGFEEADHCTGLCALEFGVGRSDLGDLGVFRGYLCRFEGFGDG